MTSLSPAHTAALLARSYFAPKPPPLPPTPTRTALAQQNRHLPACLLETLLNHTPFPPLPDPLTPEQEIQRQLDFIPPPKRDPGIKTRPQPPERPLPPLEERYTTDDHKRTMRWALIRALFREFGKREGRRSSGTVLRDHVINSVRTSREMNHRNDRRDGTLEGRIEFGWETLRALQKVPGYRDKLAQRLLNLDVALGTKRQKEADIPRPSGGPIPWARPHGGTWTGAIMLPSRLHTALPRIKPQPLGMSMMIHRREQEQNEAFGVIQLKQRADQNPQDKALQDEVRSPLFNLHLQKARRILREGQEREATPIPPELVVKAAAAKVRSMAHRYKIRQEKYARQWARAQEKRKLIDQGLKPGPLDEPGERPVGEGVIGLLETGTSSGGQTFEGEKQKYGHWAGRIQGLEGRVLIK